MSSQQLDEEAIFHVARLIDEPEGRSTYLDQVCAGDLVLRKRIEALLEIHEQERQFLKSVPPEFTATVDHALLNEQPGSNIGRYSGGTSARSLFRLGRRQVYTGCGSLCDAIRGKCWWHLGTAQD